MSMPFVAPVGLGRMTCLVIAVLRSGSHGDRGRQRLFLEAHRGARPMCMRIGMQMWLSVRQGPAPGGRAWRVSIGTRGACVIEVAGPKAHEPMNAASGRVTTANAAACAAEWTSASTARHRDEKDTAFS